MRWNGWLCTEHCGSICMYTALGLPIYTCQSHIRNQIMSMLEQIHIILGLGKKDKIKYLMQEPIHVRKRLLQG